MDLIEIKNILKRDVPLHYREDFSALAVFRDNNLQENIEIPVEFSLESNALGNKSVEVSLKEPVDFPASPLEELIKEHILSLDKIRKIR